ncbi:MAG: DUF4126 domain-containing protein [Gammaproteobacteria bacterium]|jgi:hypothetical protein|nr:MAG: DUF4126 domain-containing protein [Gammaproteobacteria bacterium]
MDIVGTVAVAAGLAWASGLRLYAVLFLAGLLGRFGYIQLPDGLHVLQHAAVIGAAGLMFVVEFFADKIPALDSLWDGIHTFIRIPAGALLAAYSLGDQDPAIMVAAGLLGGTLTAGTHLTKAGSRAVINTSPEPLSNWAASFSEDALVFGGLFTAFNYPILFLALIVVFVILMVWILPRLWRGIRTVFRRLGFDTSATPS